MFKECSERITNFGNGWTYLIAATEIDVAPSLELPRCFSETKCAVTLNITPYIREILLTGHQAQDSAISGYDMI
jgi:hypothetical protein